MLILEIKSCLMKIEKGKKYMRNHYEKLGGEYHVTNGATLRPVNNRYYTVSGSVANVGSLTVSGKDGELKSWMPEQPEKKNDRLKHLVSSKEVLLRNFNSLQRLVEYRKKKHKVKSNCFTNKD